MKQAMRFWVVLGLLGSPAVLDVHSARAEEPPAAGSDPSAEAPLEGEALKAYEKEKKDHLQLIRKEKNRETVASTISMLGTRGTRAARDALIEFAKETKNQEYVDHCFKALAKIGGPAVIELLTGKHGLRADDFLVQQTAASALETVKDPRATAALLDVLLDKRTKIEVVGAVSKALARSAPTDERVTESLMKLTHHDKDTIRSYALEAIGWLASDPAVERLKLAIKADKNTRARGAAATGMGHTKRAELVPLLQQVIREETANTVKDCAFRAIEEIEGKTR